MTNNAAAAATVWNCPNYVGELFTIGQNSTPFLNAVGGIQGGLNLVGSWEFPLNQNDEMEAADQPAITETASLTAPTPVTYVRSQDTNVCQIFQKQVSVSYAKQSNINTISGLSITGEVQPIKNEKDYQIERNLKQIAIQADYTFLNGTYQKAASAGTANKTRGVSTAISTSTVAGGSATLTKAMIDNLLKAMLSNGAQLNNTYIWVNAHQMKVINDLYGYPPESKMEGGTMIRKILTPFAELAIAYDPHVTTSELLVLDMGFIKPVGLPVPDKGVLFYEELSKTGAAETGQIYGQLGIGYGHESFHGKITGLATS